jgi:hypothetical protein
MSICQSLVHATASPEGGFVTEAVAFAETTRILKIRPEWLQKILAGEKTLEIRGSKCPHTGWVSFATTGEQKIRMNWD